MSSASPPPAIYASPSPSPEPLPRGSVSNSVWYDSRYATIFSSSTASYDLAARSFVIPYAELDLDYDTRSGNPAVADVYNDDAFAPALGVKAPLGEEGYAELFARAGYSAGLRRQASYPETRYGLTYSRDYGSFESAQPHLALGGYVTAYSRYAGNIIAAVDASADARLTHALRATIGTEISLDDRREYSNDYAEAFAGFLLPLSPGLDLRLTGVEGAYLPRAADRPAPAAYSTFRITLEHGSSVYGPP